MQLADVQQVYFIGVGGIGMSAVARYFLGQGLPVAGYDKTETPLTQALESEGVKVHYGAAQPELVPAPKEGLLVVWTPAVPRHFAELAKVLEGDYTVMKRSEVLGLISRGMQCVGIAGTHGKTTTTTITAYLMQTAGLAPHAFLGGIPRNFSGNYVEGDSDWVVVEADEFDRSFLRLTPTIAVVLSTDPDHLDIYGDHENMLETGFRAYARQVRDGGKLIVHEQVAKHFRNLSPGPSPGERGDGSARNQTKSAKNYWEIPADAYEVVLSFAKSMRSNATEGEAALWEELRAQRTGFKFIRQKPMGFSIPDFVCLQKRLIVEVDGDYHNQPDILLSDEQRDKKFADVGYLTLRFTNTQVLNNLAEVVNKIKSVLVGRPDRPHPFPKEEIISPVPPEVNALRAERAATPPLSPGEGPGERFLITFGIESGDYAAQNIHVTDGAFHFDLQEPDGHLITNLRTALPGRHNVENAVAACAVTRLAGGSEAALRKGLATFRGIARRFEVLLKTERLVIIDDYAHHPTELEAAISAARELHPEKTIRGVFQPHLYSRTQDFAAGFARALDLLDEAILIPIYPAREEPIPGVTTKIIFDRMTNPNRLLLTDEQMLAATAELKDGVLLLLGAGDIDALIPKIVAEHQKTIQHG